MRRRSVRSCSLIGCTAALTIGCTPERFEDPIPWAVLSADQDAVSVAAPAGVLEFGASLDFVGTIEGRDVVAVSGYDDGRAGAWLLDVQGGAFRLSPILEESDSVDVVGGFGDANGDGRADLLVDARPPGAGSGEPSALYLFQSPFPDDGLSPDDAVMVIHRAEASDAWREHLDNVQAVGDVNGDGVPDIGFREWNGQSATVLLGKDDLSTSLAGAVDLEISVDHGILGALSRPAAFPDARADTGISVVVQGDSGERDSILHFEAVTGLSWLTEADADLALKSEDFGDNLQHGVDFDSDGAPDLFIGESSNFDTYAGAKIILDPVAASPRQLSVTFEDDPIDSSLGGLLEAHHDVRASYVSYAEYWLIGNSAPMRDLGGDGFEDLAFSSTWYWLGREPELWDGALFLAGLDGGDAVLPRDLEALVFGSSEIYEDGFSRAYLTDADLNGDGDPELIVSSYGYPASFRDTYYGEIDRYTGALYVFDGAWRDRVEP